MVQTEELRVLLRTVADTTGARQTQQALSNVTAQQGQSARAMAGVGLAAGVGATAFGMLADKATDAVNVLGESIQVQREHERLMRAVGMAYGSATSDVLRFSQQLEATAGVTADSALEASLSARTLAQNYGLSIQQTQKLISVSADLARTRGIDLPAAFDRVQSAARGEAEAIEYLGLSINDTYMQNQAMNGAFRNTWTTMTDLEKAQARYNEILKQSAQFAGLAAASTDSLDAAFNRAGVSAHNLELALGSLLKGPAIAGLGVLGDAFKELTRQLEEGATIRAREGEFLKNLPGAFARVEQAGQGSALERLVSTIQQAGESAYYATRPVNRFSDALADLKERMDRTGQAQGPSAAELNRLALQDQLTAATRDLIDLQTQSNALQQQATALSAEEARIKLSLLPGQQQMAALQRDITEQQLRARQAALPATEALEDLRYEQQRAQVIASNRQAGSQARIEARRQLRDLARAAPGVELRALEAERGMVPSARAAARVGIAGQLVDIAGQRALAGVSAASQANQLQQAVTAGMIAAQQQIQQGLAGQLDKPMTITVNVTHEDGRVDTYTELIEANQQAQLPPVVPQSGVRRSG